MIRGRTRRRMRRTRRKSGAARNTPFFRSYMKGIHAKGERLDDATRSFFEARLGAGFSDVRLHRDDEASMAAKDIGAQAFTWRNHIVFNRRHYEQNSERREKLLGHELKHVTQQRTAGEAVQMSSEEGDMATQDPGSAEQEATQAEEAVIQPEILPDLTTFGQPLAISVLGKSISVQGRTDATFDGGVGRTKNLKAVPAKNCGGCDDSSCYTITGSLVITYSVSTTVTLPDVPEGLTKCQQERVREAIDGKITPHETQHVSAFKTYNGTVILPINYTGCKDGLQAHVQGLHDTNAALRESAAKKKSDALDPFNVNIDLDCEDDDKK